MAQNYKMPIFGPFLTWIILWREQYKKLKFSACNQLVVLYTKEIKILSPCWLMPNLQIVKLAIFFWPIEILTKFDSKNSTFPAINFRDFSESEFTRCRLWAAAKSINYPKRLPRKLLPNMAHNYEIPFFTCNI